MPQNTKKTKMKDLMASLEPEEYFPHKKQIGTMGGMMGELEKKTREESFSTYAAPKKRFDLVGFVKKNEWLIKVVLPFSPILLAATVYGLYVLSNGPIPTPNPPIPLVETHSAPSNTEGPSGTSPLEQITSTSAAINTPLTSSTSTPSALRLPPELQLPDFYISPKTIFFPYSIYNPDSGYSTKGIRTLSLDGSTKKYSLDELFDFAGPSLMSLSPDKSKLFYYELADGAKLLDLRTGHIDKLCSDEDCWVHFDYPVWSPDGNKFIVNAGKRLVVYDLAEGYHETYLSGWPASGAKVISWLSDGRILAMLSDSNSNLGFGYLDSSNTFTELDMGLEKYEYLVGAALDPTQTKLSYATSAWTEDGFKYKLHLSAPDGSSSREILSADDLSLPENIESEDLVAFDCLRFSSDGKKLLFSVWSGDQYYTNTKLYTYNISSDSVSSIELDGFAGNPFTASYFNNCPDW